MAHAGARAGVVSAALFLAVAGILSGSVPNLPPPPAPEVPAARVNGQRISMDRYRARLNSVRVRAEAVGQPARASDDEQVRPEDLTIQQLVDEAVVAQQLVAHHLLVPAAEIDRTWGELARRLGGERELEAFLARQGFSVSAYRDFLTGRWREVTLARALARTRAASAHERIRAGADFGQEALRSSDDRASALLHGDLGWVRQSEIPEALWQAVRDLGPKELTDVVATDQGYVVATVVERGAGTLHLRVVVASAPIFALYNEETRPLWFTDFVRDLRRRSHIEVFVASWRP